MEVAPEFLFTTTPSQDFESSTPARNHIPLPHFLHKQGVNDHPAMGGSKRFPQLFVPQPPVGGTRRLYTNNSSSPEGEGVLAVGEVSGGPNGPSGPSAGPFFLTFVAVVTS